MHLYVMGIHDRHYYSLLTHIVFVTAQNERHANFFLSQEAPFAKTSILHKVEKYVGVVGVINHHWECDHPLGEVTYKTRPGKLVKKRDTDLCVQLVGIRDEGHPVPGFVYVILIVAPRLKAGIISNGWAKKHEEENDDNFVPYVLKDEWNGEGIQCCIYCKKDHQLFYEGI